MKKTESKNRAEGIKIISKKVLFSIQIAENEIPRILKNLSINFNKGFIIKKFLAFYEIFKDRKLYGDPEVLVPISIFFCLRLHDISINIFDLIEHSRITKKLFLCFLFQVLDFALGEHDVLSVNNMSKLLERFYERKKFQEFRNFLKFYTNCPICGIKHDRKFVITQYFNSNKIFRRQLIEKMKKSKKVFVCDFNDQKCIFVKGKMCNFGIPCSDCIKQY